MDHLNFAVEVLSSSSVGGHALTADDTYMVITTKSCKVHGFIVSPLIAPLNLTITIASADQSIIYFTVRTTDAAATSVIEHTPFIADRGLAWKATGAGGFSVFLSSAFFITEYGN